MTGTLVGEVMREAVQQDVSSLPLEIICICNQIVKLIVSLDYCEGTTKPLLLRAWDWIGYGPGGQPGKVRGRLQILAINGGGEVVYRAVFPPEQMPEL